MNDVIEKQIEIAAPQARVWKALTDYRQFGEWFRVILEGPFVEGQSVGGQLTFPGYEYLRMDVDVKTIEPESRFAFTWHPYAVDPKLDYSQETPTLVEFTLQPAAKGTLLTVKESGFDKLPPDRRLQAFRMNVNGWEQQMKSLEAYVCQAA
jgi:uncharacterized protein YndB with AHSA1/START domain